MKYALLVLALASVGLQEAPEPYPGARTHADPPAGFVCARHEPIQEHDCHCRRMTHEETSCEIADPDRVCQSWCWEDAHRTPDGRMHAPHCTCPTTCETAPPAPAPSQP